MVNADPVADLQAEGAGTDHDDLTSGFVAGDDALIHLDRFAPGLLETGLLTPTWLELTHRTPKAFQVLPHSTQRTGTEP